MSRVTSCEHSVWRTVPQRRICDVRHRVRTLLQHEEEPTVRAGVALRPSYQLPVQWRLVELSYCRSGASFIAWYIGRMSVGTAMQQVKFSVYTYLLTSWSRVLLEKLTGFAANQEIPRISLPYSQVPRHMSIS